MVDSRARSVADLAESTILATVEIEAAPERVFRALTSQEVTEWWGTPELYRTTEWVSDVRPGGSWRAGGVGADGTSFGVHGEYLEVDPPRKVVFTWQPDWDPGKSIVTYQLEPIEGGTRLTLRHSGLSSRDSCRGHAEGWARVFGWLGRHLVPQAASSYYLIRLLSPRPSFITDMSDKERRVMGEHAAYWQKLLAEDVAVVFGPVLDPKGPWGVGIVRVDAEETLKAIEAGDPAITSGIGMRYEVLKMLQAVVRR